MIPLNVEEISSCPVCLSPKINKLFRENELELSKCEVCDNSFASRRVKDFELLKNIQRYFPSAFLKNEQDKIQGRVDEAIFELSLIQKYFPSASSVIDVGTAVGTFLYVAEKHGLSTYGTELSYPCIDYASRVYNLKNLHFGPVRTLPYRKVDAIVLWNVLEHLYYPFQEMLYLYSMLNRKGVFLIKIPNHSEETLRKYPMLPEHVCNYSIKTVQYLFERTLQCSIVEVINGFDDEIPTLIVVIRKDK